MVLIGVDFCRGDVYARIISRDMVMHATLARTVLAQLDDLA
jgi:hypothetical protein